jgi:NAD(P)H dehydrogenase (quinone)
MKKVVVINGHPDNESFCTSLANEYARGVKASGNAVEVIHLNELNFNMNLMKGYKTALPWEPDLEKAGKEIKLADHLVFVYPTWWGTFPALMKGFIDRVFLPGFAFKTKKDSVLWHKLLKGKSARLIVTMDTPKWYYSLVYRNAGHNAMKRSTLMFSGIKPVKTTVFTPIKTSSKEKRQQWLEKSFRLGNQLN